ncbi:MAG: hypothetical protein DRR19_01435 [Candidatus Parabeggiatoa sp. nov. 1]|nr:MAG: hypothetical protein DRR19_01435 [Gammaproteobacteria bacterium]
MRKDGKVVPHGLYDIYRNVGYMTGSTSHETSEFAWSLSSSVVVKSFIS